MERYELLKDIGAGNFGVARLMRNKETKELVAMKYIPRGLKVLPPAARGIRARLLAVIRFQHRTRISFRVVAIPHLPCLGCSADCCFVAVCRLMRMWRGRS